MILYSIITIFVPIGRAQKAEFATLGIKINILSPNLESIGQSPDGAVRNPLDPAERAIMPFTKLTGCSFGVDYPRLSRRLLGSGLDLGLLGMIDPRIQASIARDD
jgi:hypothetical protein